MDFALLQFFLNTHLSYKNFANAYADLNLLGQSAFQTCIIFCTFFPV